MTKEKDDRIADHSQRLKDEEQLIKQLDSEIRKMEQ